MTALRDSRDVEEAVRSRPHLLVRGGGTKAALSSPPPEFEKLELGGLVGVQDYLPGEYTLTALAGTPIYTQVLLIQYPIQTHLTNFNTDDILR